MSTLTATVLGAPSYQVGLGGSLAQSEPFDLITGAGGQALGTYTPLTSFLVLNGSSTITSLTIQLPSNPTEGQRLRIWANQTLTTLTMTAGTNATGASDTIVGGLSALTASTAYEFAYRLGPANNSAGGAANLYTWYRVQ